MTSGRVGQAIVARARSLPPDEAERFLQEQFRDTLALGANEGAEWKETIVLLNVWLRQYVAAHYRH
jgi:hypothetical protein